MKLTVENHREAIKRYGHVKPARGWRAETCGARCPGTTRSCTRPTGHHGPHVAHGMLRRVVAVWDSGPPSASPRTPERRAGAPAPRPRRRVATRAPQPFDLRGAFQDLAARAIASADQIAFIILFIVFVKFAIDVLMTLH